MPQYLTLYTPDVPANGPPGPEHMAEMGKLVETMNARGALAAMGAMQPGAFAVRLAKGKVAVGELVRPGEQGFALLNAKDRDDAIRMVKEFLAIAGDGQSVVYPLMGPPSPDFDASPVKPGTTLNIVRLYDAPRELVFQCWTDPRHLKVWWGPSGSDNGETRVDLRPGGELFIQMRGPGFDHPMGGEFLEIAPPSRLVFLSKAFQDAAGHWEFVNRNTLTFEDAGNGRTRMTLNCVVQSVSKTFTVPVGNMAMGWNGSLDRLSDLLTRL